MASLSIKGIGKRFGALEVLKSIDIDLPDGEFLVLLGASGCGKSTLLSIIAGLTDPSEGSIAIEGKVVTDTHPKDRDIAMVFQSYALYPNMTVEGNIAFALEMRGIAKDQRREAIARVAQLLRIDHLLGRKPAELSGGQRQRVAIGRALVREPKVFLFDEPLSNLDAKLRVEMRTEIKKLHERLKATIVYVTHDQIEAMTLASRIAIMKEGRVEQLASPDEIYERPASLYVAGFIGSPPMNFLDGTLQERGGQWGIDSRQGPAGNEQAVFFPLANPTPAQRAYGGRAVILGIRPEAIELDEGSAANAQFAVSRVPIDLTETTGADTLVYLTLGGRPAVARLAQRLRAEAGESLPLRFDMKAACLFDPKSEQRIP